VDFKGIIQLKQAVVGRGFSHQTLCRPSSTQKQNDFTVFLTHMVAEKSCCLAPPPGKLLWDVLDCGKSVLSQSENPRQKQNLQIA